MLSKNMKFERSPFIAKEISSKRGLYEIYVKDKDGVEKKIHEVKENLNMIHPYSRNGKNYLIEVSIEPSEQKGFEFENEFKVYELIDSNLKQVASFSISSEDDTVVNQLYIPRAVFHKKQMFDENNKDISSWWITYDNEEESSPYDSEDEEKDQNEESAFIFAEREQVPNYVKYADYIALTISRGAPSLYGWQSKLCFVKLDKFDEGEFKFIKTDITVEGKSLREIIRHYYLGEKNSFKRFDINTIFVPETEKTDELVVLFKNIEAKESIAKVIRKLLPMTEVYMHDFKFIGMITFLGKPSLLPKLEERLKNIDADIQSIEVSPKVTCLI